MKVISPYNRQTRNYGQSSGLQMQKTEYYLAPDSIEQLRT